MYDEDAQLLLVGPIKALKLRTVVAHLTIIRAMISWDFDVRVGFEHRIRCISGCREGQWAVVLTLSAG